MTSTDLLAKTRHTPSRHVFGPTTPFNVRFKTIDVDKIVVDSVGLTMSQIKGLYTKMLVCRNREKDDASES